MFLYCADDSEDPPVSSALSGVRVQLDRGILDRCLVYFIDTVVAKMRKKRSEISNFSAVRGVEVGAKSK